MCWTITPLKSVLNAKIIYDYIYEMRNFKSNSGLSAAFFISLIVVFAIIIFRVWHHFYGFQLTENCEQMDQIHRWLLSSDIGAIVAPMIIVATGFLIVFIFSSFRKGLSELANLEIRLRSKENGSLVGKILSQSRIRSFDTKSANVPKQKS